MRKEMLRFVLRSAHIILLCAMILCLPSVLTSCGDDEPEDPTNTHFPTDGGNDSDSNSSGTGGDINDFDYYVSGTHFAPTYYDPEKKEYTYCITIGFGVENMYSKNLAVFGMIVRCDDGEIYMSTDTNDAVRAEKYGNGYYIWDIIHTDKLDMAEKSIWVDSKKSSISLKLTPRWEFNGSNSYFEGVTTTKTFSPCSSI